MNKKGQQAYEGFSTIAKIMLILAITVVVIYIMLRYTNWGRSILDSMGNMFIFT